MPTAKSLTKNKSPEIRPFVDNSECSPINDKLSKTFKISEGIISESCEQCPRYSGIFIYKLLALVRV